jgi:ABC-2 type transport system permease protein
LALGGIIVPVDRLPGPIAAIAHALPATALSDVLRLALGAATGDALSPLILLGVWGAIAVGLAAATFSWE